MLGFANSDLAFQRQPRLHGQLPRLHHLRHRAAEQAEAGRRRSSARAGRATSRSTATCCSCRWSRRAAASTAARRASRRRSAPSASAASASSTSPTSTSRSRSRRFRPAADRTPTRWSPIRNDKANLYVYGSGTSGVRSGEELAGCSGLEARRGSEHGALQHRRDPGADRRAAEREDRQPAAHLRRHGDRRHRRPQQGRRQRPGHAEDERDQPVPRHHGVPGSRPRRRRLLGQRRSARHQRSEEPEAPRRRLGQELRLLALGDVQQRRHQGDLHRRVGRRRAAALPRDRSAQLGRRRDLRHRRSEAACSRATTRCRRRRPSRRTASRTTAR